MADQGPGGELDVEVVDVVDGAVDAEAVDFELEVEDVRAVPRRRSRRDSDSGGSPFGSRREARERALSLLYEADAKNVTPADLLAEIPVPPPPYVVTVVRGVGARMAQIDELIARFAIDWTVDRMPVIDRTLVRMATFELLCLDDVPTGVVISEAVELAKRYSTEESGRFVNGLLASIAVETRPAD
jgi:N utilization substance protein B